MRARRPPTIRYRSPVAAGAPSPGDLIMGDGPRTRRAYRVLTVRKARKALPALGCATWVLTVEPMSIARGREEHAAGTPAWTIKWDARRPAKRISE
jgi:hypothetical protein